MQAHDTSTFLQRWCFVLPLNMQSTTQHLVTRLLCKLVPLVRRFCALGELQRIRARFCTSLKQGSGVTLQYMGCLCVDSDMLHIILYASGLKQRSTPADTSASCLYRLVQAQASINSMGVKEFVYNMLVSLGVFLIECVKAAILYGVFFLI